MDNIKLYRKRYIPNETVFLKDDEIISVDSETIITKWDTLKPRKDFAKGISVYYLKEGYKVSELINSDNKTVYYYCDIIEPIYNEKDNSYIFNDLLADVKVYSNGKIEVVDLDELAEAFKKGLITSSQLCKALKQLDRLLKIIYSNGIKSILPRKGITDGREQKWI